MDKLNLNLDDLEVQSFEPGASVEDEAEGTIFGQAYEDLIEFPPPSGDYRCTVVAEECVNLE